METDMLSPSMPRRNLETRQNHDANNVLKSCCFEIDKRALQFCAALLITIMVILFAMMQLSKDLDCATQNLYVGIITLVLGVWLPAPQLRR